MREEIVQKATAIADDIWQEILETERLDRLSPARMDFIEYFEKTMSDKKKKRQWNPILRLLRMYAILYERTVTFEDAADRDWHESFKNFLLDEADIDQTTAHNYYKKIISCIEYAVQDRLIEHNVARGNGIPNGSFPTVYLTPEEINTLANTPEPDRNHVKDAFLFAIYTGLRSLTSADSGGATFSACLTSRIRLDIKSSSG